MPPVRAAAVAALTSAAVFGVVAVSPGAPIHAAAKAKCNGKAKPKGKADSDLGVSYPAVAATIACNKKFVSYTVRADRYIAASGFPKGTAICESPPPYQSVTCSTTHPVSKVTNKYGFEHKPCSGKRVKLTGRVKLANNKTVGPFKIKLQCNK